MHIFYFIVKKTSIYTILYIYLAIQNAFSDDSYLLSKRLKLIHSFYAGLTQKIISSSGDLVQESTGEIWIKKPNLFKSHIFSPYENISVSDGKTLWLYDSTTNQVIACWINEIIVDTPLYLIMNDSQNNWKNFTIKNINDTFYIFSKKQSSNFKKITIIITKQGILKELNILSNINYQTNYTFNIKKTNLYSNFKFKFRIPKGATLDDQRK
ncbi:MAG: periplasmic lipoprotein chaperone [Wigglesworthia glossinidia]|nr:periplasmic lipoprotein chaperone [Wigglesworthia glossinidia]